LEGAKTLWEEGNSGAKNANPPLITSKTAEEEMHRENVLSVGPPDIYQDIAIKRIEEEGILYYI
jgi:hypothetical protein